jgi:DNA-binding NtrC family response regulator
MTEPPAQISDPLLEYHGALLPRSWIQTIEDIVHHISEIKPIIVVRGESGTGRDTMARVIHAASPRRHRPFIKIRCGVRPPDRLATELFGHERDAFPGADRRKIGKLEFAHGGTLLLDEVEDLPRSLQALLLDSLRERSTTRLGSRERIRADIQVVATTRQVLRQPGSPEGLADAHPLKVVDIELPPLRARRHDMVSLANGMLDRFNTAYGRHVKLQGDTLALLSRYDWPGNVRELVDALRHAVLRGDESDLRHELEVRLTPPPAACQTA